MNMYRAFSALLLSAGAATPIAMASFHVMQIEQVIAGVNGDVTAQAIQLRMRAGGQSFVSFSRVIAWDAAGSNPVLIKDMTTNVSNGVLGDRVLIVSPNFHSFTAPSAVGDFTMTNLIPASYLAAGSLTFEDDFGTIYWRLSWGGSAYTGPNDGNITNDANGNFGPAWSAALNSSNLQALQFINSASAPSTDNLDDYQTTAGAAVFTNNARTSFTVITPGGCTQPGCDPGDLDGNCVVDLSDLGALLSNFGKSGQTHSQGDTNGDGVVDLSDLAAVLAQYGHDCH